MGNPYQPGVGQRVAEQPLHGHPGQRQHRAHRQPQQGARQADLTKDHLGLLQAIFGNGQPQQAQASAQGIEHWQADWPQRQ